MALQVSITTSPMVVRPRRYRYCRLVNVSPITTFHFVASLLKHTPAYQAKQSVALCSSETAVL